MPSSQPSLEALEKSYQEWNPSQKPILDGSYMIVMLPGDAPDEQGTMHYFTRASAKILFEYMVNLWKIKGAKHQIVIQNIPRTGKHDPKTGAVVCNHEYTHNTGILDVGRIFSDYAAHSILSTSMFTAISILA